MLLDSNEWMTIKEIAYELGLSEGAVRSVIERYRAQGLVKRAKIKHSKKYEYTITNSGIKRLEHLLKKANAGIHHYPRIPRFHRHDEYDEDDESDEYDEYYEYDEADEYDEGDEGIEEDEDIEEDEEDEEDDFYRREY